MKHLAISSSVLCLLQGACVLTTGSSSSDTNAEASASADPIDHGSDSAGDSEPAPSDGTGDASTTDPVATSMPDGASSSESSDAADTTTIGDTSSGTTGAGGMCGWVEAMHWYDCGGEGEDPDGFIPIACDELPVTGAPCDGGMGPIADPGCCWEGMSAYCYLGQLVVEVC